jgi:AGZA family xanthine/uracil permease-like MFS transporter
LELEEVKRELLAGATTFFTMSYILVVNPVILSSAGVPFDGALFATAVSSAVATFLMGVYASLPFALAPGMGLNAYFAYTVCGQMGINWKTALTAVFLEGVIFLVMALFGLRRAILRAIPSNLAYGISAGIGLFIALIGLKSGKIVEGSKETLLKLGELSSPESITTLLTLALLTYLVRKRVTGSLLIGIIFATGLAFLFGKAHLPTNIISLPEPKAAFQLDWSSIFNLSIIPVVLTFLLVDVFDTVGTLSALCARLGIPFTDKRVGRALTCDAVGTTVGGLLGTSTVTTYVESATGVAAGGRSGLTAVTVSFLFLLSLFLYPLIEVVPPFATSAVLIYVGFFMAQSLKKINWDSFEEAFPPFLAFILIPFTFSIWAGILGGFGAYGLIKLFKLLHK